jgi:alpha-tubulin suppressor-like RCC1 family protein
MGNSMISIKTDGSLWVWGYQDQGQLGINNIIPRSSPVQVGATTDWALISSGQYTQMAIKTNGTLWGWGRNDVNGTSIGDNTRINRSSPVQIGSDTNWSTVAMGRHNGSAIKTNGTLWAWGGAATSGATGQNNRIDRSSPVQIGTNTNWVFTAVGGDTEGTQFVLATANTPY